MTEVLLRDANGDLSGLTSLNSYTVADRKSAEQYFAVHWERHKVSLAKFGINTEKVYMEDGTEGHTRVVAICTYDGDVAESEEKYMASPDFWADMEGFDMSKLVAMDKYMIVESLSL